MAAAQALGLSHTRILFRHILVSCYAAILVVATLNMGTAITVEATLSFLGLGAQPIIGWGRMLARQEAIRTAPHTLFPARIVFDAGVQLAGRRPRISLTRS